MRRISQIIVHQSASSWGDRVAIDRWHKQRGWSGIGYHKVVLNGKRTSRSQYQPRLDGKIQQGRDDAKAGAHARGDNRYSIGICCIGDGPAFSGNPHGYMTEGQWAALVDACYRLCQSYDISYDNIVGHRDTADGKRQGKTCPGFDSHVLRYAVRCHAERRGR